MFADLRNKDGQIHFVYPTTNICGFHFFSSQAKDKLGVVVDKYDLSREVYVPMEAVTAVIVEGGKVVVETTSRSYYVVPAQNV